MEYCMICRRTFKKYLYKVFASEDGIFPFKDLLTLFGDSIVFPANRHICVLCLRVVRIIGDFKKVLLQIAVSGTTLESEEVVAAFLGFQSLLQNVPYCVTTDDELYEHFSESVSVQNYSEISAAPDNQILNTCDNDDVSASSDDELTLITPLYSESARVASSQEIQAPTPNSQEIEVIMKKRKRRGSHKPTTRRKVRKSRSRVSSALSEETIYPRSRATSRTSIMSHTTIASTSRAASAPKYDDNYILINKRTREVGKLQEEDLEIIMQKESIEIAYKCNVSVCCQQYESLDQLNKHLISDHEMKSEEIDVIDYNAWLNSYNEKENNKLKFKLKYQQPSLIVDSKNKYPCPINSCNKRYESLNDLSKHKITGHHLPEYYPCNECSLRFTCQKDLEYHFEDNHSEIKAQCMFCSQHFENIYELYVHLSRHEYFSVPCRFCDKYFLDHTSMMAHKKTHDGDKDKVRIKRSVRHTIKERTDTAVRDNETDDEASIEFCRVRTQFQAKAEQQEREREDLARILEGIERQKVQESIQNEGIVRIDSDLEGKDLAEEIVIEDIDKDRNLSQEIVIEDIDKDQNLPDEVLIEIDKDQNLPEEILIEIDKDQNLHKEIVTEIIEDKENLSDTSTKIEDKEANIMEKQSYKVKRTINEGAFNVENMDTSTEIEKEVLIESDKDENLPEEILIEIDKDQNLPEEIVTEIIADKENLTEVIIQESIESSNNANVNEEIITEEIFEIINKEILNERNIEISKEITNITEAEFVDSSQIVNVEKTLEIKNQTFINEAASNVENMETSTEIEDKEAIIMEKQSYKVKRSKRSQTINEGAFNVENKDRSTEIEDKEANIMKKQSYKVKSSKRSETINEGPFNVENMDTSSEMEDKETNVMKKQSYKVKSSKRNQTINEGCFNVENLDRSTEIEEANIIEKQSYKVKNFKRSRTSSKKVPNEENTEIRSKEIQVNKPNIELFNRDLVKSPKIRNRSRGSRFNEDTIEVSKEAEDKNTNIVDKEVVKSPKIKNRSRSSRDFNEDSIEVIKEAKNTNSLEEEIVKSPKLKKRGRSKQVLHEENVEVSKETNIVEKELVGNTESDTRQTVKSPKIKNKEHVANKEINEEIEDKATNSAEKVGEFIKKEKVKSIKISLNINNEETIKQTIEETKLTKNQDVIESVSSPDTMSEEIAIIEKDIEVDDEEVFEIFASHSAEIVKTSNFGIDLKNELYDDFMKRKAVVIIEDSSAIINSLLERNKLKQRQVSKSKRKR